jgi:hypothetical protein
VIIKFITIYYTLPRISRLLKLIYGHEDFMARYSHDSHEINGDGL